MVNLPDPEKICEEVLRAAEHIGPPTNLEAICSLWSDLKVIEEDLDQAGYLVSLGVLGADLLVRKNDPPARKSFTVAHELGHWTLASLEAGRLFFGTKNQTLLPLRSQHKRQTPEEVWCNRFAACLLMPREDVDNYLTAREQPNLPERIWKGHSVFQVSEEAFLSRVSEMTDINIFEVVTTDSNARVRRRFYSRYTEREEVEKLLEELLEEFPKDPGLLESWRVVNNYQVQSMLTRQSSSSRSWMVSVVPEERQ